MAEVNAVMLVGRLMKLTTSVQLGTEINQLDFEVKRSKVTGSKGHRLGSLRDHTCSKITA